MARDQWGFIFTGPDLPHDNQRQWHLDRPAMALETSLAGVFAAGDVRHGSVKRVASAVGEGAITIPLVHRCMEAMAMAQPRQGRKRERIGDTNLTFRPLLPHMRLLLFVAAVLVFLAGFQLFVFTEQTATHLAWTIVNPLGAAFLGAAYWSAVAIEALAGRQALWANARIAVPAVLTFTVLTLITTLLHLGKFHLGGKFETATQFVTWAWIAIYVLVPLMVLIVLVRQARVPGTDPPRSAALPSWLYVLLGMQAVVFIGFGIALFVAPAQTSPLWPWKLTTLVAQATASWLIAMGVAAGQALFERCAWRLLPASAGSVLLGILELIALARYPHQFRWGSASGVIYLIFLATVLLAGAAGLIRGLRPPAAARQLSSSRTRGITL